MDISRVRGLWSHNCGTTFLYHLKTSKWTKTFNHEKNPKNVVPQLWDHIATLHRTNIFNVCFRPSILCDDILIMPIDKSKKRNKMNTNLGKEHFHSAARVKLPQDVRYVSPRIAFVCTALLAQIPSRTVPVLVLTVQ